jgi:hypothetical protein
MLDSVAEVCEAIAAQGGVIVQLPAGDAPEIMARFKDPAANLMGLNPRASGLTLHPME